MAQGVSFKWGGITYRIPDSEVFQAAERMENILPLSKVQAFAAAPNVATLARLFAAMIEQAGGRVDPRDIRRRLLADAAGGGEDAGALAREIQSAQGAILGILMDGAPIDLPDAEEGEDAKKTTPHLSKRRTSRRSANGG
jgi:hypothetical protein